MPGAAKKAGRYLLTRQVLLSWGATDAACALHRMAVRFLRFVQAGIGGDQVEDKRPKALALATACVRLWTPSLP